MGLDSHLFRRGKTKKAKMLTVMQTGGRGNEELAYWRKCSNITGIFLDFYKGNPETTDLNCKEILLSKEALIQIANTLREELAGQNEISMEDIEVIEKAIKETDFNTQEVYFWAWW